MSDQPNPPPADEAERIAVHSHWGVGGPYPDLSIIQCIHPPVVNCDSPDPSVFEPIAEFREENFRNRDGMEADLKAICDAHNQALASRDREIDEERAIGNALGDLLEAQGKTIAELREQVAKLSPVLGAEPLHHVAEGQGEVEGRTGDVNLPTGASSRVGHTRFLIITNGWPEEREVANDLSLTALKGGALQRHKYTSHEPERWTISDSLGNHIDEWRNGSRVRVVDLKLPDNRLFISLKPGVGA